MAVLLLYLARLIRMQDMHAIRWASARVRFLHMNIEYTGVLWKPAMLGFWKVSFCECQNETLRCCGLTEGNPANTFQNPQKPFSYSERVRHAPANLSSFRRSIQRPLGATSAAQADPLNAVLTAMETLKKEKETPMHNRIFIEEDKEFTLGEFAFCH